MKNLFVSAVVAIGGSLLFSACSDSDPSLSSNDEVLFEVTCPSTLVNNGSRSIGEGEKSVTLTYAIYDEGSSTPRAFAVDGVKATNGLFTFSLRLPKNRTYEILFWADAENASDYYTFDPDTKSVTINYDGAMCNDDSRDAFYASKTITITGDHQVQNIQLTRPFAQLNVGTEDLDELGDRSGLQIKSKLTFSGIPSVFNLSNGSKSNAVDIEFSTSESPLSETFPTPGNYDYLAMAYVLPPTIEGDGLSNVTCTIFNGIEEIAEIQAPTTSLIANHRTNICGNLLTDMTDFQITITPVFDDNTTNGNQEPTQTNAPSSRTENDGTIVYNITTADELQWIQKQSVSDPNFWNGHTFELGADIVFPAESRAANYVWTPIDIVASRTVDIDGKGHSVAGFTFADNHQGAKGLFGTVNNAHIHDFTIVDVTYVGSNDQNVGALVGYLQGTIENITVRDIDISVANGQNVGAVAGTIEGTTNTLDEYMLATTSVEKCQVHGEKSVGAIAGQFKNTATSRSSNSFFVVEHPIVTNSKITASDNRSGILAGSSSNVDETIFYNKLECSGNNTTTLLGSGKIGVTDDLGSTTAKFENGTYCVYNSFQLRDAFSRVSEGQTIELMADIDYHGLNIEPHIAKITTEPIIFDGKGHVIRNFEMTQEAHEGFSNYAFIATPETGLFANIFIKNTTFVNCSVKTSKTYTAIVVSRFVGNMEKINLLNCKINCSETTGLMTGSSKNSEFSNCSIRNCSIEGSALSTQGLFLGQLGQNIPGTFIFSNCSTTDNRINNTQKSSVICGKVLKPTASKHTIEIKSFANSGNIGYDSEELKLIEGDSTAYDLIQN